MTDSSRGHKPPAGETLEPGRPVDIDISGSDAHAYRMQVGSGQFIHVVVLQFGIHVRLELYGLHGRIASAENPDTTTGLQQISTIAKSTGHYDLKIIADDKNVRPGTCRVLMEAPHLPTKADNSRILAERAFANAAEEELDAESPASHRLAVEKYKTVLPFWQGAGDNYEEAITFNVIASIYEDLGKSKDALNYYNNALNFWRAVGDRGMESMTHSYIARIYDGGGDEQKAIDEFNVALASAQETEFTTAELYSLNGLGKVYFKEGDVNEAFLKLNQALNLAKELGDDRAEASSLDGIGMVRDVQGDAKAALDDYQRALTIEDRLEDDSPKAETLNKIGGVYSELGEEREALRYYRRALSLATQAEDVSERARIYNNISLVYDDLKQWQVALSYFNKALALWRSARHRTDEGKTLDNIGFLYHNLGDNRKALFYYDEALTIAQAVKDRGNEAMALHNIGVAYDKLGQTQKAWSYENRGLLLFRKSNDMLNEGLALSDLMRLWKRRNAPLAILFGKEAINKYQEVRRNIQELGRNLAKSFVASKENTYRELADLLISSDRFPEALTVLDMLKVEEFSEYTHRRGLIALKNEPVTLSKSESAMEPLPEFTENEKVILDAKRLGDLEKNRHRTLLQETEYGQLKHEMTDQNRKMVDWYKALYLELGGGKGDPGAKDTANSGVEHLDDESNKLQQLLRKGDQDTIAVYTLIEDDKLYLVMITAKVIVKYPVSISRIKLDQKILEFVNAISGRHENSEQRAKAEDLYKVLVNPLEKSLKENPPKTVLWSLDGWLRYVPIPALYDGSQYLAERFANVVISDPDSGRLQPTHIIDWRGVAMGVSKEYIKLGVKLGQLPSVPEELDSVITSADRKSSHGPVRGTIMLDDSFTVSNMEDALSKPSVVVHIATHYLLNPNDENQSYLLLGGKDIGGEGYLLSLTDFWADESLDLEGVELITLAGCQTGKLMKDTSDGREIDALANRAQKRGAKAVIATLWDVDDASSKALMQEFYRLWASEHMTKSEALRKAQVELMNGELRADSVLEPQRAAADNKDTAGVRHDASYSAPYYWAPFVLMGNWN